MEMKRSMGFLLLLLIALAAQDDKVVMLAEARTCELLSRSFKGLCMRDGNCGMVCRAEDRVFTGGKCQGARRRCFCIKNC